MLPRGSEQMLALAPPMLAVAGSARIGGASPQSTTVAEVVAGIRPVLAADEQALTDRRTRAADQELLAAVVTDAAQQSKTYTDLHGPARRDAHRAARYPWHRRAQARPSRQQAHRPPSTAPLTSAVSRTSNGTPTPRGDPSGIRATASRKPGSVKFAGEGG